MNTIESSQKQPDVWEKWAWVWKAIFYTTVLASMGLMLRDSSRAASIWVAVALTAALLVWHWAGFRLAYKDMTSWDQRAITRFILIMGDIILWFLLVNISTAYYLALFGLFAEVFRHLPIRFAAIAAILLVLATIVEQVSDTATSLSLRDPAIWVFLLIGLGAIVIGIWVAAIIQQSTRRRELIEQLESTRAELAAAERREGMLEERQRLSREIHDTLAQGFTSIYMHLEAAEQALPDNLEKLQKHMGQARSTARSSLDQARRVVMDLRPDLLERHPLPEAIGRAAQRWEKETGIPVNVTVTGNPVALHPKYEVTLLRGAQEALNNVHKHARASAVQLTLSYMHDVVMLDIQDDGIGLTESAPSPLSGGYGLQAMRERAEQCGGALILESDPGEGTTVVITLPQAGGS